MSEVYVNIETTTEQVNVSATTTNEFVSVNGTTTEEFVSVNGTTTEEFVSVNGTTTEEFVQVTVQVQTCEPAIILLNGDSFLTVNSGGTSNVELEDENGDTVTPVSVVGSVITLPNSGGGDVIIERTDSTIITTATAPSTFVVPDSEVTLKDSADNVLRVVNVLADSAVDEIIADTTVQLKDSAGANIGSVNSYLAESSNNKTAPDATVTLNGNAFLSPRSNQVINSLVTDKDGNTYQPYISGSNLIIAKERRQDFQTPYSYCGYAQYLSNESANVWKVARITVNNDGTTTVGVANNVNWTNRYTHIYL